VLLLDVSPVLENNAPFGAAVGQSMLVSVVLNAGGLMLGSEKVKRYKKMVMQKEKMKLLVMKKVLQGVVA